MDGNACFVVQKEEKQTRETECNKTTCLPCGKRYLLSDALFNRVLFFQVVRIDCIARGSLLLGVRLFTMGYITYGKSAWLISCWNHLLASWVPRLRRSVFLFLIALVTFKLIMCFIGSIPRGQRETLRFVQLHKTNMVLCVVPYYRFCFPSEIVKRGSQWCGKSVRCQLKSKGYLRVFLPSFPRRRRL